MPPLNRMLVPPSRSDAIRSGSAERSCRRFSLAAMSSGEPTETMSPPTWSESTHVSSGRTLPRRRRRRCPGIHGITSCAILSRTDSPASRSSTVGTGADLGPERLRLRRGGGDRRSGRRRRAEPSRARGAWRAQVAYPAAGSAGLVRRVRVAGSARRRRPTPGAVRPGIEVLLTDSAHLVRDRRVGLVTNQSGVDASGVSDVVRLRAAGVRLVALFSPEHGFRGAADPGAAVASSVDSATGLPIYSLYGRTSAPTDEMLAGIDVLLVDLQDAGARYYTYITTTVDVMQAAGRTRHSGRGARSSQSDRRGGAGERARGGTHHAGRPARPCPCGTD